MCTCDPKWSKTIHQSLPAACQEHLDSYVAKDAVNTYLVHTSVQLLLVHASTTNLKSRQILEHYSTQYTSL